jgi:rsbT co-antagonist protein RsbR
MTAHGGHDPRQAEIHRLILDLARDKGDESAPVEAPGDETNQVLSTLRALAEELRMHRSSFSKANERLSELSEVMNALLSLDYERKAQVGDENDILDGMAAGLNMLGEELSATTVSRAYVSGIIESMTDMLLVVTPEGIIQTANQAAVALLRYERDELTGACADLVFPGFSAEALIEQGGLRDDERLCKRKDGSTVTVALSTSILDLGKERPEGLVCVARDLTATRRLDEERWQLREAVQRQSILLHELSTPLIPISDKVLAVPLIGPFDEERASQMTATLLEGITDRRTEIAILDITGVRRIDAPAITGLVRAVRAIRLIGVEAVMTGIRSGVAKALCEMEIDLGGLRTFGSLQQGIVYAMNRTRASARPPGPT